MSSVRQYAFPYSELVIRQVQAGEVGSKKFYLPRVPNLDGKTIIGVEAFSVTATPVTPTGNNVIAANPFSESFLTIVDNSKVERVRQIPMAALLRANNNGNYVSLDEIMIDCEKSYIDYGDLANPLTANECYMLVFYYHD